MKAAHTLTSLFALSVLGCTATPLAPAPDLGGDVGPYDWAAPDRGRTEASICSPPTHVCADTCCASDQTCKDGKCVAPQPPCGSTDGCDEDARCVAGACTPWDDGSTTKHDPGCTRAVPGGLLRPQLQCAWEAAAGGKPGDFALRHTPVVAQFKFPNSPSPSVVVVGKATYSEGPPRGCTSSGKVVVLDGRSCKELFVIDHPVLATVTPALADLTGNGRPEIIVPGASGGLVAFTYDDASNGFVKLWHSTDSAGKASKLGGDACLWGGVTVADLDGGRPEIFFHGVAHDAAGTIIGSIPNYRPPGTSSSMVLADVNLDGTPDVVEGYGTYVWNGSAFALIAGWKGTGATGFVAVADFGEFPGTGSATKGVPEAVIVDSSGVRIQSPLGEQLFFGPGGYGLGGPPTVADMDGDGQPEIGVAYGDKYVVYDLGCKPVAAGCQGEGILWSKPSQDKSSARTGSSVFDFNGDGRAEVVYGDECFVRVYDGPTGKVIFSQGRMSSTWQENPIVVDVDGDAAAEIVLPASSVCNPGYCGEWDASFVGLSCDSASDCPGGPCDAGYCRCSGDAQCGTTFSCTPATGLAGTGNVCRTKHKDCAPGLRIFRDARDRWAGSRTIWNQHAYHVTNVEEDGTVPSKGQAKNNWQQPGLNNFRQNVQGKLGPINTTDLTVRKAEGSCTNPLTLTAEVCNRGPAAADRGVGVSFIDANGGQTLCDSVTTEFIDPGTCVKVMCISNTTKQVTAIRAVVNGDGSVAECKDNNNQTKVTDLHCVG